MKQLVQGSDVGGGSDGMAGIAITKHDSCSCHCCTIVNCGLANQNSAFGLQTGCEVAQFVMNRRDVHIYQTFNVNFLHDQTSTCSLISP